MRMHQSQPSVRNKRQQEAAPLLPLKACLMNRVSMFSWSRRRVPSARAKPPVKCSLRLLQQEQKCWLSGGGERMPRRQLHFKQSQLQRLLSVVAVTDNCLSFSVKGNLGTLSEFQQQAGVCACGVCFESDCVSSVEEQFLIFIIQLWQH